MVPGCAYWYTVTTQAEGLSSVPSQIGPGLATAEVSGLSPPAGRSAGDADVENNGAGEAVGIFRGDREVPPRRPPPRPPATGCCCSPTRDGTLIDTGLTNEQAYGYRVCCVYQGPNGKEVVTRGEAVLLTPAALPPLITGLGAELRGGRLRLRWQNPAGATIVVLRHPVPQGQGRRCVSWDASTSSATAWS